jgi:hypothetical protein
MLSTVGSAGMKIDEHAEQQQKGKKATINHTTFPLGF